MTFIEAVEGHGFAVHRMLNSKFRRLVLAYSADGRNTALKIGDYNVDTVLPLELIARSDWSRESAGLNKKSPYLEIEYDRIDGLLDNTIIQKILRGRSKDIIMDNIELPEGVTSIGHNAFFDSHGIKHVMFPETLSYIDSMAFDSSGIRSVEIPASVRRIDEMAFGNCMHLKSVTVAADCDIHGDAFPESTEVIRV